MPRVRIYNRCDLQRELQTSLTAKQKRNLKLKTPLDALCEEESNLALKEIYHQFNNYPGLERVTDKIELSSETALYCVDGKIIRVNIEQEPYNQLFGGKQTIPLRIEFSRVPTEDQTVWKQVDQLYFIFQNFVKTSIEIPFDAIIKDREIKECGLRKKELLERLKKDRSFQKPHNNPI